MRTMTGPRAVWSIFHRAAPKGIVYRCCHVRCVNPKHLRLAATRQELTEEMAVRGVYRSPKAQAARAINVRLARKARGIVDTPDHAVIAIRASSSTLKLLAAKFGISESAVSQIRIGRARQSVGVAHLRGGGDVSA